MELIKNDVKIELEDIGEGWDGDYNEEDPEDTPLLRFSAYVKGALRLKYIEKDPHGISDWGVPKEIDEWVSVSDGTYCTRLPADLSDEDQLKALEQLMLLLYDPIVEMRAKKPAQKASWIGPDNL